MIVYLKGDDSKKVRLCTWPSLFIIL